MAISNISSSLIQPGIEKASNAASPLQPGNSTAAGVKPSGVTFDQLLNSLNQSQDNSDALIQKLAAGEDVDVHQVMIASEQADISMRVAIAIRDRLVDSYREVMRMSV